MRRGCGIRRRLLAIVLGADDGNEAHWTVLKQKLADEGIDLEVRTINDGVQLNQGVQDGELDVNLFQHLIYLSQFNVENNGSLVPVGATAVYPLALYSEKYQDVKDLPEGAKVAIPNNPTNLARGLLNLQTAGLLTLKDGGTAFSTPADIVSTKVELLPVDTNRPSPRSRTAAPRPRSSTTRRRRRAGSATSSSSSRKT